MENFLNWLSLYHQKRVFCVSPRVGATCWCPLAGKRGWGLDFFRGLKRGRNADVAPLPSLRLLTPPLAFSFLCYSNFSKFQPFRNRLGESSSSIARYGGCRKKGRGFCQKVCSALITTSARQILLIDVKNDACFFFSFFQNLNVKWMSELFTNMEALRGSYNLTFFFRLAGAHQHWHNRKWKRKQKKAGYDHSYRFITSNSMIAP